MVLSFDTDFDHPMESSIWGHPERLIPFVVNDYEIVNDQKEVVHRKEQNHQTRNEITFDPPLKTTEVTVKFYKPSDHVPVALFGIEIN